MDLSFIVPAREEKYLGETIHNILANIRADSEILVALDGWEPNPSLSIEDKRVRFYKFEKSIGQRAAINYLVKQSDAKYIMKIDAHCAIDEGMDAKLMEDIEPSWTVVPRMYNLDITTWTPKWHKVTDYMYISSPTSEKPFRPQYFEGKAKDEGRRQPKSDKLIDDTMCCMGCGWFMERDRFLKQGGCDEGHVGGWGQQSIEVGLKAWLSGGGLKVNKKTWFAHWFRGNTGFPYPISREQIEDVRRYSQDLWLNDKWPLATKKLQWVIDKFDPPGWKNMHKNSLDIMKKFFEEHLQNESLSILDVGSQVIRKQRGLGSYRQFVNNPKWKYTGADIVKGENVDIELADQYTWQFKPNSFDVVISGQVIEHVEEPWTWFKELARVLKPKGKCCVIAPAVIHEHKYPIDTYRFYPDGMRALAKWAGLKVIKTERVIVDNKMEDTYLIAEKAC